ncbi:MAG TPA: hypothetical protein DEV85_04165 [Vibrio sp.]|nr:hypothetical protein [Vibrio sp.]
MIGVSLSKPNISFVLEVAALLTAFIHPPYLFIKKVIDELCSWGLIHLSPHCNSNYFGYRLGTRAWQKTAKLFLFIFRLNIYLFALGVGGLLAHKANR